MTKGILAAILAALVSVLSGCGAEATARARPGAGKGRKGLRAATVSYHHSSMYPATKASNSSRSLQVFFSRKLGVRSQLVGGTSQYFLPWRLIQT
jgi:hypothetical protein